MLDDAVKAEIQTAYSNWLTERGFRGRRGQRSMIAAIAQTFADDDAAARIVAIEAGTGTGKTLAYLLAGLPIARYRQRRLVVSTATIALQEQLVFRDLPDVQAASGLRFSFELAKGRGRYLCPQRLGMLLAEPDGGGSDLLFTELAQDQDQNLWRQMQQSFVTQRWDGDRDRWPEEVADSSWQPLTTDHRGCSGAKCEHFRHCPYFLARGRNEQADVVVVNHDLLLADLAMGGGVLLPEPEKTLYVFDEAHHLAEKAQSHFSVALRVNATLTFLEQMNPALGTLLQRLGRPAELIEAVQDALAITEHAIPPLQTLAQLWADMPWRKSGGGAAQHRFVSGVLGEDQVQAAQAWLLQLNRLTQPLTAIEQALAAALAGELSWPYPDRLEWAYSAFGQLRGRVDFSVQAAADMAAAGAVNESDSASVHARWLIKQTDGVRDELRYHSAPITVDRVLAERLWARCDAALLTSATLAALGRFDGLRRDLGLPENTRTLRLPSPFDYRQQGVLAIPRLTSDPGDRDAHTAEICELMPQLLESAPATLALFTSWKQMRAVHGSLPRRLVRHVLCQGEFSRTEILKRHRAAIDGALPSTIFGVASFAEGIDLPGAYCTHVIIAKLPFPVPDEPVFEALSEWLQAAGRDSFNEVSVPHAALRLVQACGRLIRNESDTGRVTLLDRRVLTRAYGRAILNSLPPFRREIAK